LKQGHSSWIAKPEPGDRAVIVGRRAAKADGAKVDRVEEDGMEAQAEAPLAEVNEKAIHAREAEVMPLSNEYNWTHSM